MFLTNGSIQSVGSHAELLKTNAAYKEFFETKTQGKKKLLAIEQFVFLVEAQEESTPKQMQNGKAQNGIAKTEAPGTCENFCTLL